MGGGIFCMISFVPTCYIKKSWHFHRVCSFVFFILFQTYEPEPEYFEFKTIIVALMPNDNKMTYPDHHILTLFCSRWISKACLASLSLPSLICFLNCLCSSSTCGTSEGETDLQSWIKRQMSDWTECEEHTSCTSQTSPFHEERCTLLPAPVSLLDPLPVAPADDILAV